MNVTGLWGREGVDRGPSKMGEGRERSVCIMYMCEIDSKLIKNLIMPYCMLGK